MDTPARLSMALLLTTHALSLAVWIGVMLFNLVVNFPAQRARARNSGELTALMGSQAHRAAPWLYALIALTALSGIGLQWQLPQALGVHAAAVAGAKWAALGLMAALHAWGSWRLWPRIYFALDSERPALFMQYQVAMATSAALGIGATALSFYARAA
jgi:hypothetical protein